MIKYYQLFLVTVIFTLLSPIFFSKHDFSLSKGFFDSNSWQFEAQRQEISPKWWVDEKSRLEGEATLALSGNGKFFANGCWTKVVAIQPNEYYEFETYFLTENVEEPNKCILARILWQNAEGKQIGRAEYPATMRGEKKNGWHTLAQIYKSPEKTKKAKLELIYRWDANGMVHFGGIRFEKTSKPASRLVRLASIHHKPKERTSTQDNLKRFAQFIIQAGEQKADIVCLPEGITVVNTGQKYVDVSEPVPGPSTRFLGKLAKKYNMYIIAGIYERDGAAVYNTAVLLDRAGVLAGKYRKVCLPREEIERGLTPGDSFPVFDTDFGRIGMMICWDVFFPEPARMLALKGADIIFLPIWGGNLTLAQARAIENQVYLVSSTYNMKSGVFDQEGKLVAEADENTPVIVYEVDLNKQKLWPFLGDFKNRIPREMPFKKTLDYLDVD